MANSLSNPTVQFVIAAHANHLDLTPYINASRKDIIYDKESFLTNHNIIKSSTVIFMKNGTVDTTVVIDAKQLEDQLSYIESKMP